MADDQAAMNESSDDCAIGANDDGVACNVETCNVAPGNRVGVLVGQDEHLIVEVGQYRLWVGRTGRVECGSRDIGEGARNSSCLDQANRADCFCCGDGRVRSGTN